MLTRTCLCLITRTAASPYSALSPAELLLGFKKSGFGAGKWVGIGGHVEPGEEPVAAAAREVAEESGLVVRAATMKHMAELTFRFPARPAWDQVADVFVTSDFDGEPAESDEIAPRWFGTGELPYALMWDDARYWLPLVLAGQPVAAEIGFAPDCSTVASIVPELTPLRPAPWDGDLGTQAPQTPGLTHT